MHALVSRIAALAESPVRIAALHRALLEMSDNDATQSIEYIIQGTLQKRAPHTLVYGGLIDSPRLADLFGPQRMNAMYTVAMEESLIPAQLWLMSPTVRDDNAEEGDTIQRDNLIAQKFRDVPLGVRRALARRARGEALVQLAQDPDPIVITNILNNSRTTESHVIAICAQRPTTHDALEAVIRSEKWLSRYRVKLALLKNPYLRLCYGITLLPYLSASDLNELSADPTLSQNVRYAAGKLASIRP